jgi:hypothetical protein
MQDVQLKPPNCPIASQIYLAKIKLRPFQEAAVDALENGGFKKLYLLWHRRAGKDYVSFYIILRQALISVGTFFYCLPTFAQARRVVFESILSDGTRFLDMIPKALVSKINIQQMSIYLINGSHIQIVGSNTIEQNLVGCNPKGIVFSEWARSLPSAFTYIRPALVFNDGFSIFITTPYGKNHSWQLHERAKNSKDWFISVKTVADTGLLTPEQIAEERKEFSEEIIQQEYYCSYLAGEGAYYSKYINAINLNGQITEVPYDPTYPVHTAWDLGVNDLNVIIYFQVINNNIIHVIDCDHGSDLGLDKYVKILASKPYGYGRHFAPHDIAAREYGTGLSRIEIAKRLGLKFEIRMDDHGKVHSALPMLSIDDGIELVKMSLSKMWFDEKKCKDLLQALENYRREWSDKIKDYLDRPLHNRDSHFADCVRYLATSLPKLSDSISADELRENYEKTAFGRKISTSNQVFNDAFSEMF